MAGLAQVAVYSAGIILPILIIGVLERVFGFPIALAVLITPMATLFLFGLARASR
jgi:hypothetical protein